MSIFDIGYFYFIVIHLCCRLCSIYKQAILCIMVQFNAPFAHIQPTSSLYILLRFFVDCIVWHLLYRHHSWQAISAKWKAVKSGKNWNNRETWNLNWYNFLPSYSFMELVTYINAQYCSAYFHIFISLVTCVIRSQIH